MFCQLQNQNQKMAQKHYQNDYKRLIGLDESRTASEKLLDKAMPSKQRVIDEQSSQPTKRVKKQQQQPQQVCASDVWAKITKTLLCRNNIIRMQKSLQICLKCSTDQVFANALQLQSLEDGVNCLADNSHFPAGSLGELTKLAESELLVLDWLRKQIKSKCQDAGSLAIVPKIQLEEGLMKLINDDSFNFSKQLASLKTLIWKYFQTNQTPENQQNSAPQRSHIQKYILRKLMVLPNLHFEWAHTAITNFLKEFIVGHRSKLQKQKQFLEEYNKLLSNKKIGVEKPTSDIMGAKRSNTGGTYTLLERQDSTHAWCKRQ